MVFLLWATCFVLERKQTERESYKQKPKLTIADLLISGCGRLSYWYYFDFVTVFGFCNSGQRCPPCRMTGWMADNEFKNPKFCEIDQLPKKSRFSFERSLLTPYSERSKVAKTNCHSARSKVESQNLIVILREAKWNRRIYLRTDDGFCNFGQRCPPCRMTWSTADNEFKDSKFCEIEQFPKKFRFS